MKERFIGAAANFRLHRVSITSDDMSPEEFDQELAELLELVWSSARSAVNGKPDVLLAELETRI
jgi:hypothetical protein